MRQIDEHFFVSGNESVALAALDAGIVLGTGYPGTPSTEILEYLSEQGGKSQWAPNEKIAMGVAFGGGDALVTMKHVGLNVAADPLFSSSYTELTAGLVIVVADDYGMTSSQNEQDSRHYSNAAGVPLLEPGDSQEAYEYTQNAFDISRRWRIPVLLRMTTRVCHSKSTLRRRESAGPLPLKSYERNIKWRVMLPCYARPAHRRLCAKLDEIADWAESVSWNREYGKGKGLGIVSAGVSAFHAIEAVPDACILKLGILHPLPKRRIKRFIDSVNRCLVIEEGDPFLSQAIRAEGLQVESKPIKFRFGELSVERIRKIVANDEESELPSIKGKAPELCPSCAYRTVFGILKQLQCIVAGDIGCYSLGGLPPFDAIDAVVNMGASIGIGLGLRRVLPEEQAKRVVSIIGDSTFMHSGVGGLIEMAYNPPQCTTKSS